MRILIIEDHAQIARNLRDYLQGRGHEVVVANDGRKGFSMAAHGVYDGIVLDLGLPRMDGLALSRKLRDEAHVVTPILMLTARDTLEDKLAGFEDGADDYVVKPFALQEVEARLTAMHKRRSGKRLDKAVAFGAISYEPSENRVTFAGAAVKLSPQSLRLLEVLLAEPERIHGRQELELELWGCAQPTSDRLRNRIHVLRTAMMRAAGRDPIKNVPGVGFVLIP